MFPLLHNHGRVEEEGHLLTLEKRHSLHKNSHVHSIYGRMLLLDDITVGSHKIDTYFSNQEGRFDRFLTISWEILSRTFDIEF